MQHGTLGFRVRERDVPKGDATLDAIGFIRAGIAFVARVQQREDTGPRRDAALDGDVDVGELPNRPQQEDHRRDESDQPPLVLRTHRLEHDEINDARDS